MGTGWTIAGWLVEVIGGLYAVQSGYFIRKTTRLGGSLMTGTVNVAMVVAAAVVLVPYLGYSPLHLLWLLPFVFLAGGFTYGALSPLGRVYGNLWCVGLGRTWREGTAEVIQAAQRYIAGHEEEKAKDEGPEQARRWPKGEMSFLKTLRSILPPFSPSYPFDSTVQLFEHRYDRARRGTPERDRNAWLAAALHGQPGWKQPLETLLVVTAPFSMTAEEPGPSTALGLFVALSEFRDRFPSEAPTPEAADVYNERADKYAALCAPVLKLSGNVPAPVELTG
jgi:hypothetical protein